MKVVILCGGLGTRLREETEFKPKPLVDIGGMPILWHVMKIYSAYGFKDFILCLGYKGNMIKEFFLNYKKFKTDFTLNLKNESVILHGKDSDDEDWNITFADTGSETQTGGRVKKIEKYIDGDSFLLTYGDGVGDVDIKALVEHHKRVGRIGTITGVIHKTKYGNLEHKDDILTNFAEKPVSKDLINGGFMVFNKEVFDFIKGDVMLEKDPFKELVEKSQLSVYKHCGFWHCMDTYKDYIDLNEIWKSGVVPWIIKKN